ncbi:MAG: GTPase ObgE [Candidatus Saccharibacteria bacterium]
MFVDVAKVFVKAGRGGDGIVSFRHEIYIDKGGPNGGDGGRGGDVIFKATENLNTLLDFRYKPELKAENGANGGKQNKHGKSGENLIVKVPVGTIVRRNGDIIADLTENNQEVVIAIGGRGGFGNAHFKSSVRQVPRIAELGEPGEEFEAELELKLLADVGLIGFPNAGKSTFLSVISNAKPEIANYEFTTLTPNLGVADVDQDSILIADIPGLIEGASKGKGLGDAFLRHVERTAVLLHLIDAYSDDIKNSYLTIRNELKSYSKELDIRPEIVAITKIEGLDQDIVDMQIDELKKVVSPGTKVMAISSMAHKGLKELLRELNKIVKVEREKQKEISITVEDDELPVISLNREELSKAWNVEKVEEEDRTLYIVTGEKIERFAIRTNFDQEEGVDRLRDILKKLGIAQELLKKGAESDSIISISGKEFTLVRQYED